MDACNIGPISPTRGGKTTAAARMAEQVEHTALHTVLDFDKPLRPEDIQVGNVLIMYGKPRTIHEVKPLATLPRQLPPFPQLIADVGHGDSQAFYIATCYGCHVVRAFPGLHGTVAWYGVTHNGEYRVYCSADCTTKGIHDND